MNFVLSHTFPSIVPDIIEFIMSGGPPPGYSPYPPTVLPNRFEKPTAAARTLNARVSLFSGVTATQ